MKRLFTILSFLTILLACQKQDESKPALPCNYDCSYKITYRLVGSVGENIFSSANQTSPFSPSESFFTTGLNDTMEFAFLDDEETGLSFVIDVPHTKVEAELTNTHSDTLHWQIHYSNGKEISLSTLRGYSPDYIKYDSLLIYYSKDSQFNRLKPDSNFEIPYYE